MVRKIDHPDHGPVRERRFRAAAAGLRPALERARDRGLLVDLRFEGHVLVVQRPWVEGRDLREEFRAIPRLVAHVCSFRSVLLPGADGAGFEPGSGPGGPSFSNRTRVIAPAPI